MSRLDWRERLSMSWLAEFIVLCADVYADALPLGDEALDKMSINSASRIYKSSSSQHVSMHDEIEFLKASNRKRNVTRVEKRHPSIIDWVNTQFYEGYAVVQCYDWKGKFAYEAYLYSIEQLPLLLTPFWIPCKLDKLLFTR